MDKNTDAFIIFNLPNIQVDHSTEEKYIQLEIPLYIIQSICRFPVKWLRYVAWAILHVHGNILVQPPTSIAKVLEDDATLSPNDVLYFLSRDNIIASATVNRLGCH
ncbi:hypothetical protein QCA50_017532 [Cerrena zonata]|uniref:Uncharacterized protein n=1 Tax=Cerrena zonata TaxID=2478898 RepID=A0AAW0FD55_9APHY